jgi:hypothetical protein
MNDFTATPFIKIQDTKEFQLVVISDDRRAASRLFPSNHERLGRFKNITSISHLSELLNIYVSNKDKKLVVFVDVTSKQPLHELKEMIYGAHAEKRGLLFAFTFGQLAESDFERLISTGFDDVFELQNDDSRKFLRMYSWIRRFGGAPISEENAERDAITFRGQKNDKRIGKWTIIGSEKVARDDRGQKVGLTRQEIDFLALLFDDPESVRNASYDRFFKAPHAIVHKLKKKLGSDLPVQHDSGGRYYLVRDDRMSPGAKSA